MDKIPFSTLMGIVAKKRDLYAQHDVFEFASDDTRGAYLRSFREFINYMNYHYRVPRKWYDCLFKKTIVVSVEAQHKGNKLLRLTYEVDVVTR